MSLGSSTGRAAAGKDHQLGIQRPMRLWVLGGCMGAASLCGCRRTVSVPGTCGCRGTVWVLIPRLSWCEENISKLDRDKSDISCWRVDK